ncbi:type II toxin-antitoxin system VapC family toxin [Agromyces albus]|uniref:Ribonuclease VapC n=1 Tax=Agromyces albus TaxID=205332 RepID=A0A4Q2L2N3_9MICO|nr:type II toxin-antitoxin system VapC family toxin [Agromyces albus]RXZ72374.1 PIN domain-containing protein [Agromyces albus]
MAHYLDTSALVKLVIEEAESAALAAWLTSAEREPVTSDVARTELLRSVRRWAPEQAVAATQVLEVLTVLTLATSTFDAAARMEPVELRSFDALHVAAALELGDELDGFVTYDDRQADAVRAYGILVVAPR